MARDAFERRSVDAHLIRLCAVVLERNSPQSAITEFTEIAQRGLGRNQILAPEEPNVYSTAINRTVRAPAERNVSDDDCASRASFAPLERGEPFGVAGSINISSLRDEEKCLENLAKKTRSWTFVLQSIQLACLKWRYATA